MCPDCAARRERVRERFLNAQFKKGVVELAKGAAEIVGLKEKNATKEADDIFLKRKPKTAKQEKDDG